MEWEGGSIICCYLGRGAVEVVQRTCSNRVPDDELNSPHSKQRQEQPPQVLRSININVCVYVYVSSMCGYPCG